MNPRSGQRLVVSLVSLALVFALASRPLAASPDGQHRSEASSSKTVRAQGTAGSGLQPVSGAPESPGSSTTAVEVSVRAGRPGTPPPPADPVPSRLRALSSVEGEATVELDGVRQPVRAGSQLGSDIVRSVGPGRIVLERVPEAGTAGAAALVIVRFDASGRARTTLVWTADPTAPGAPEVKRP